VTPATVFVVDDHPVVRDGVTLLLRSDPCLSVVGSAESGRLAIERVAALAPDLILLDLRLPDMLVDPRILPGVGQRSDALARSGLTRREYEVLRLAAQGQTNPEIAESTGLARNTVKTYLQSALHKLGARNRVEAIGKASEAGLL
jgi:DNA-binding NarL/FixJ family response regulator